MAGVVCAKAPDRSTVATPALIARLRKVVPAGIAVVMPMAFSLAVGPASSALTAAPAGAFVAATSRCAVAMNGP